MRQCLTRKRWMHTKASSQSPRSTVETCRQSVQHWQGLDYDHQEQYNFCECWGKLLKAHVCSPCLTPYDHSKRGLYSNYVHEAAFCTDSLCLISATPRMEIRRSGSRQKNVKLASRALWLYFEQLGAIDGWKVAQNRYKAYDRGIYSDAQAHLAVQTLAMPPATSSPRHGFW